MVTMTGINEPKNNNNNFPLPLQKPNMHDIIFLKNKVFL